MIDKVVDKGKALITIAWGSTGCIWVTTNHILAAIATLAAIAASVLAARYYHMENKRRNKKLNMDKELHDKKMNGG